MPSFIELTHTELDLVITALDYFWHNSTDEHRAVQCRILRGNLVTNEGEPPSEKIHHKL